jgi:hypothetical protein
VPSSLDLWSLAVNVGYTVIRGVGGFATQRFGRRWLEYLKEERLSQKGYPYEPQTLPVVPPVLLDHAKSYQPSPPREPTIPNVLNYPAPPEPDPEPSPLALLNRRWKYTSMATAASRLQEPPKGPRERERPMKLPASSGQYLIEPESPVEQRPGMAPARFADEAWATADWSDCTTRVAAPDTLPGYGWVTPEQCDWMQELKQQLIERGEAECREGRAEWVHEAYREKLGELDLLVWNAVRTGMSMFDWTAMLQWERENGAGTGLFNTTGRFEYRSGPGFL